MPTRKLTKVEITNYGVVDIHGQYTVKMLVSGFVKTSDAHNFANELRRATQIMVDQHNEMVKRDKENKKSN